MIIMVATKIYCGTSEAATSVYISNVADPDAGAASDFVIYLNPNQVPENWNSKAIASYDAPSDYNDIILAGNIAASFTIQNNRIQATGSPPTHLNNLKKAFQDWSLNDDQLYFWNKNPQGYNNAQFYNASGSLVQIRVKWFKWVVTEKKHPYWRFNVFLQRVSPNDEYD